MPEELAVRTDSEACGRVSRSEKHSSGPRAHTENGSPSGARRPTSTELLGMPRRLVARLRARTRRAALTPDAPSQPVRRGNQNVNAAPFIVGRTSKAFATGVGSSFASLPHLMV